MKIAALEFFPWFFVNDTHTWGPMQNLADNLAERLNFRYVYEAPEDGQWGQKTPTNWTGLVGMIYNNRSDLSLGPIALTWDRSQAGDFGALLTMEYLTVLSGYPSQAEPNAFGTLMAFDWTVR
ncbi:glutamate receptor-like [Tropilaelaps mercedesae]|uniref:Glutamate receptor-like n=1 Tax=Tropilaelaps mercedesae TaxID=418985 RepID=A0A1V9X9G1_9ACAR|nr:glutamate receptor-like [Tropilaelaps mercedesae]